MNNQRRIRIYSLVALLAISLAFISCEKDDPIPNEGEPKDSMLPIDENSSFNMKNFIISFDQLFNAQLRWAWDFSHEYNEGKAIRSFQNYKFCGSFGKNYRTIEHTYNYEGIIISSERAEYASDENPLTFTYEFDKNGFINKLTKIKAGKTRDIVSFEYNAGNQLLKKTHLPIKQDQEEWYESFTYNAEGQVASYYSEEYKEEYLYEEGNMIEAKSYKEDTLFAIYSYEYDDQGRAVKMYEGEGSSYSTLEYSPELLIVLAYENEILIRRDDYALGIKYSNSYSYFYKDEAFDYSIRSEFAENLETQKKYYYQGTISDLEMVGYSTIDERDQSSHMKLKETVYNSVDLKLYYLEFTLVDGEIAETNWFEANGSQIAESEINETWVIDLVHH